MNEGRPYCNHDTAAAMMRSEPDGMGSSVGDDGTVVHGGY